MRPDVCIILLPNTQLHNPKMQPPLGILYLSAIMKQMGCKVEAVDGRDGSLQDIPKADFYMFSCTTPEIGPAKVISSGLDGHTVVGGPHPTLMVEDCIGYFDTVVCGEGELALEQVLAKKHGVIRTGRLMALDHLPLPDWSLIPEPFSSELLPGEKYGITYPAAPIMASRGCRFNCSFCGNCFRSPVVFRSVDNIIGEMAMLLQMYGITRFRFVDDNFMAHPDLERFCRSVRPHSYQFRCHGRADLLDYDTAKMMKEAGCIEVAFGVESGDDDVLRLVHKGIDSFTNGQAIRAAKKAGMLTKVFLIMGLPGETEESCRLTKEFMAQYKPDKWTLNRFTPYPGCAVFKDPYSFGVLIHNWDYRGWWNFFDNPVYELVDASVEVLNRRYLDMYNWLSSGEYLKVGVKVHAA